jgi:TMEM175 potassium channel family protein
MNGPIGMGGDPPNPLNVSTGRLEAFSDGVFAVAATLLVLNVTVPTVSAGESLGHALANQWQLYLAYANSFITIGIIWINHHAMISRLRSADHSILILNLVLLLWVALLPFATSLMTDYLRLGHGQHLALAVYAGMFLLMSATFAALNWHILFHRTKLMREQLSAERRRQIISRGVAGLLPYAIAAALAAVSPYITLAICVAVALFYALPIASGN